MIRLHIRCWVTGPGLPAAGGMAALVLAAALLALWASIRTGIPILNITVTMLLPLALGGSAVTTLLLPARPCRRRVVNAPAGRPCPVRRGPVPAPFKGCGAGTTYAPGRLPRGRAQRPAAANRVPPPAAAELDRHLPSIRRMARLSYDDQQIAAAVGIRPDQVQYLRRRERIPAGLRAKRKERATA